MAKTTATLESRSSKSPQPLPAITYRLSDKAFLECGWTIKPNTPSAIPVVVMRAKFSNSAICPWFRPGTKRLKMNYADGKPVFIAKPNGTGSIYYPNGKLAVKIVKGGIDNCRSRIWVYSTGDVNREGIRVPYQLCALFDSLGNGVVYDSRMNKRLVYNQREGVLLDSPYGSPVTWKWHTIVYQGSLHSMNEEDDKRRLIVEPPKQLISAGLPEVKANEKEKENHKSDKKTPSGSPSMLSTKLTQSEIDFRETLEHPRYVNTAKVKPRSVSPLKPIVLRLNQYLCLRIFSQSEINLTFYTTMHQTKLKIGVLYNPFDKLKVVEIDNPSLVTNRVICPFEDFPPNTKSMLRLRRMLQAVKATS